MSPEIRYDLQSKCGTEYGTEEEQAVLEVLRQNAPTSGDACLRFEEEFAAYCGTDYARVVSNGTAALFLSMIGIGVGPGDHVITTPMTWIATAAAPATLGADVEFADIDPETYNIDPDRIEEKLRPDTKAVVIVHLYGQCCDMDRILALSEKHGFAVVEDACHAIGASWKGRAAGSMGAAGCFSFHEQKNISTLGEGGVITTSDSEVYERIALYRSHCTRVYGKSTKYCSLDETALPMGKRFWWQDFDDTGYNFRMTDIQAAVGRIQLRKLDALNSRRRQIAEMLTERLSDVPGLILPRTVEGAEHVWHLYPLQLVPEEFGMDKEDFIWRMMHEQGIKIGAHYNPLHWSTAFRKRGFEPGMYPVADHMGHHLVTLPVHPRLTDEAVEYLAGAIRKLREK